MPNPKVRKIFPRTSSRTCAATAHSSRHLAPYSTSFWAEQTADCLKSEEASAIRTSACRGYPEGTHEPRTLVECATPEELSHAPYQGHSTTYSREVPDHSGASFHEERAAAFTLEEILVSVFAPSIDGAPAHAIEYGQPRN